MTRTIRHALFPCFSADEVACDLHPPTPVSPARCICIFGPTARFLHFCIVASGRDNPAYGRNLGGWVATQACVAAAGHFFNTSIFFYDFLIK